MFAMPKNGGVPLQNSRFFSIGSYFNQKTLYETLGISPKASQADVKAAFYKLSKKHHPDANSDDPSSTSKFQEIVEAYEVLGNEAARKRYDVGMPAGQGATTTSQHGFKTADDPKAAFYKSRLMNKVNSPVSGRVYNFDAWTQQHYSRSIRSNRELKSSSKFRQEKNESFVREERKDDNNHKTFAVTLLSIIMITYFVITEMSDSTDVPKRRDK